MLKTFSDFKIGRSHIKMGLPCQDYAMSWTSGDYAISVLCDGAGSCSHSDIGAKAVSQWFIDYLRDKQNKDFTDENEKFALLRDLQILLLKTTASEKCAYNDLSSTFLAVVAKINDDFIDFTSFHIGDGLIAVANGEEVQMLSDCENGIFANVTVFTSSKDAYSSLRIQRGRLSLDSSFILMSDGSGDCLCGKKDKVFSKTLSTLHSLAKNGKLSQDEFLEFISKIAEKTKSGDDCSLSLMTNVIENPEESIAINLSLEGNDEDGLRAKERRRNEDILALKEEASILLDSLEAERACVSKLKKDILSKQKSGEKSKYRLKFIYTPLISFLIVMLLAVISNLAIRNYNISKDLERLDREKLELMRINEAPKTEIPEMKTEIPEIEEASLPEAEEALVL